MGHRAAIPIPRKHDLALPPTAPNGFFGAFPVVGLDKAGKTV